MSHPIRLKRVYDAPDPEDGARVLVERLWPRGTSKDKAAVDLWMKEIAPSPELRKWYGHDAEKWEEFVRRYRAELESNEDAVRRLEAMAADGHLTLVFASRDAERCSAVVLRRWMEERAAGGGEG